MIFVRTQLNDHTFIEVAVRRDNTFARCSKCGRDFLIDIADYAEDEEFDPNDSYIMCEKCSSDFMRGLRERA